MGLLATNGTFNTGLVRGLQSTSVQYISSQVIVKNHRLYELIAPLRTCTVSLFDLIWSRYI